MKLELFNYEITKFFARHCLYLFNANILYQIPRPFLLRLLEEYLGIQVRRWDTSMIDIHAAIDILETYFKSTPDPPTRAELLRDVCDVFIRSENLDVITDPLYWFEALSYKTSEDQAHGIAFLLAIGKRWTGIQTALLDSGKVTADVDAPYLGTPMNMAIRLGYEDTARMLVQTGAALPTHPSGPAYLSLKAAARKGHSDILDLVVCNKAIAVFVLEVAASNQQWHIVDSIINRYSERWLDPYQSVLRAASKHGKDSIVQRLIDLGVPCGSVIHSYRTPLDDAISGGHVTTCNLLIKNGAIAKDEDYSDIESRSESVARSVARGGSVGVLTTLRNVGLWKDEHRLHLLPIAAEYGHVELAKYVVEHGMDKLYKPRKQRTPFSTGSAWNLQPIVFPQSLRYFALLRAIASGHLEFVRWMILEMKLDPDYNACCGTTILTPLLLAVDTGNVEMVRVLVQQLNATPLDKDRDLVHTEYSSRLGRQEKLNDFKEAFILAKDYKKRYFGRSTAIGKAFWAATEPRSGGDEIVQAAQKLAI